MWANPRRLVAVATALGVLATILLAARPAVAESCAGVTFPDTHTVAGKKLVLNGVGLREATALKIDVYVAALYVTRKSSDGRALAAAGTPAAIVIKLLRDVGRSDMRGSIEDGFRKAAGGDWPALKERAEKFRAALPAVKRGQTLAVTYTPEHGTVLSLDDKPLVTIEGADFARVLTLVWLRDNAPDAGLRRGLLGAACK